MTFFKFFTPISYWLLSLLWLFIFVFYINRVVKRRLESKLFITLLIILAIDAFRTLFESIYFGAWYTSLAGFIPKSIHTFLVRPENVFIPKIINVIAAILIIVIVLRRWLPEEMAEREKEKKYLEKLEREITERKKIEIALIESEERLIEAQKLARLGHYVLDIKSGYWKSSPGLDAIFGIGENYKKDIAAWIQLIHSDHQKTVLEYFQNNVLTQHQKFDKKYKILNKKTNQESWVHGLGNLKFDENNNPSEMFGTIQDITERIQAEEEREKLIEKLQDTLADVKTLTGLLPICAKCKKIRDDKGYWNNLEGYIEKHSEVSFSHSMCLECSDDLYGKEDWYIEMKKKQ